MSVHSASVRRIVVFAPHFAEYATRLAVALSAHADVLLVTEARNLVSECTGLAIATGASRLTHVSYESDYALRHLSLRGMRQRRRIFSAIEDFRPDMIHVQEQGDRFTAAIATAFSRAHPIVVTVHDPVPHSGNDALVARRFAVGLARIRAVASAYHVHGAFCEALLRRTLDTSKPILSGPLGVILVPPAGNATEANGDRYLFFGRMEAYKGLDTLLDAIELLPAAHGLRFVLAGRGPEVERHRERIRANSAIELVERFLPPLEAIQEFQRARVVLAPYHDATQSAVISAAFGNGKPVIASKVGGLVDAVADGENGLLIAPNDPQALAAAIRAMTEDATCGRLAAGARNAAAGPFAWSAIAEQMLEFYAQVRAGSLRKAPTTGAA